jgi:hypothetical protein
MRLLAGELGDDTQVRFESHAPGRVSQPALPTGMIVAAHSPPAQLINPIVGGQAVRLPPPGSVAWVCSRRIVQ